MNNRLFLIAIVCGLLTAWLFLGQFMFGGLGVVAATFTAMPLFVAVLGFGTVAGLVAGGTAAAIVAFVYHPIAAAILLLFTLGPALWIGHMAGLSRNDTGVAEWFPLSTIVERMAVMCAAISIIVGLTTGFSIDAMAGEITKVLTSFIEMQQQAGNSQLVLTPDEISQRARTIAAIIPLAFPASLFLLMAVNATLAERFTRKRGWMLRPKEDLPTAVALPQRAVAVFAAAGVASFASGTIALAAQAVAGAYGAAFIAVGLATVHDVSKSWPARKWLLALTYLALLFTRVMSPIFALFGVAETLLQLRARARAGSNQSNIND